MNEQSIGNWWSLAKCPILESPRERKTEEGKEGCNGGQKEGGTGNVFEEIAAENFLNSSIHTYISIQIQGSI